MIREIVFPHTIRPCFADEPCRLTRQMSVPGIDYAVGEDDAYRREAGAERALGAVTLDERASARASQQIFRCPASVSPRDECAGVRLVSSAASAGAHRRDTPSGS